MQSVAGFEETVEIDLGISILSFQLRNFFLCIFSFLKNVKKLVFLLLQNDFISGYYLQYFYLNITQNMFYFCSLLLLKSHFCPHSFVALGNQRPKRHTKP